MTTSQLQKKLEALTKAKTNLEVQIHRVNQQLLSLKFGVWPGDLIELLDSFIEPPTVDERGIFEAWDDKGYPIIRRFKADGSLHKKAYSGIILHPHSYRVVNRT